MFSSHPAPPAPVLAMAAAGAGGAIGALARYGAVTLSPPDFATWPWVTFAVNVVGCLALGMVMHAVLDRSAPHPLARPFLATGVLGGFTTFSAVAVETRGLLAADRPLLALAYVAATFIVGVLAVEAGRRVVQR